MKFTFFWLFFLSFCFIQNTAFAQSDTNLILTLKERLENVSTVEEEVGLLNDIAWEYYYQNFDSAMYYANLALAKSDELEDEYWQSVSLEMKAILMEMSGQYEEAISLYLEVIPLRQKSGGEGLENTYNNMAALFQNQQNYETSLIYFKKSLEIEEERNNQNGIAACLINLGISYKNLGKLDTAGVLFRQANILSEAIKDSVLMIHSSLSLGDYFYQDNKKDSATYFYEMARVKGLATNDLNSVGVALQGLGNLAREEGRLGPALDYLDQAENYLNTVKSFLGLSNVYFSKAKLLKASGKHQEATTYYDKYIALNDSLRTMEILRLTADMEQKYESERKERQITELELQAAEQELQVRANRARLSYLVVVALLLLFLGGFYAYRYRTQRKNSLILSQKNKTIEIALKDKEVLLQEIHHRVKNNLQVVSSLLSIQGREIEDPKALEAVKESQNRVKSMALIHQYLYGEHDLKSINMQEYVSQLSQNLFDTYRLDRDLVELKLEIETIHLDVDTAVPLGIILNELITNSLKYAFPEGQGGLLEVSLFERENCLVLMVKDNGIGQIAGKHSGTNFGMKLIRAFEHKLGAAIEIVSENGYQVTCKISKYKRIWLEDIAS
ncbi:tetratricopeptide repeat protein [Algoriphagus sp. NF]|uniref:histidine kinase dimerization/phosphoacceptor domain -containing protein n=2 Tax=Algoriphagus TaxID=246875 RepID=UPI00237B87AE|nr:histidine kinase dimerization/phosphoacceptor domain -containing protein [Algoriphagus sp. NF]MDE0561201.1 tetratricopeptide repeat protein [Algoriphagus sp. NF]